MATRAPGKAITPAKGRATPRRPARPPRKPRGEFLTYNGKHYRMADKIGIWPLMQLARAAQEGVNSTDLRGLAALHAMFQDILHPDDFPKFEADMIASKFTDPMGLLETTQEAVARIQARQAEAEARAQMNGHAPAADPAGDDEDDDYDDDPDPDDPDGYV